ncbi:MAG: hypothetical protein V1725_03520 [archaeon]
MARKGQSKYVEIPIPDKIAIIISGFFGGILPGIAIKTGVSVDPNDWAIMILKQVCHVTQEGIPFNCYALVTFFALFFAVIAFLPVLEKAIRIKSIQIGKYIIPGFVVGLILYGVGFLFGVLAIIKLLS